MGMNRYLYVSFMIILALAGGLCLLHPGGLAKPDNASARWLPVEGVLGVAGEYHADGTATFEVPRNLTVTLNGTPLAPGADLSHEIRIMNVGDKAIAVGELVLTEDEIPGVTQKLRAAGIRETALHNHLLRESPRLMYLHFHAYGDPVEITTAISDIIVPLGEGPDVPLDPRGMDTARLDAIMGAGGKAGGGVYAFDVPRANNVTVDSGTPSSDRVTLPPSMDISTEVIFQPLGGDQALAIGEYVLEADEVEPVIGRLTGDGFAVDALHSHMLTEEPRLFYLHCWAKGDAAQLASRMREALDLTKSLTG